MPRTAGRVARSVWALLLALVFGGCVGTAVPTTTTTTTTTTSTTTTTTTTIVVTTTAAPTTTTLAPVTVDSSLPAAESRSVIPWEDVGADWVLALYSGAIYPEPGPSVLYLVSPGGTLYEIMAWRAGRPAPVTIDDWSPDQRRALLRYGGFSDLHVEARVISLYSGEEITLDAVIESSEIAVGFAGANGERIVKYTDDGSEETLELLYADGSLYSELFSQRSSSLAPVTWLADLDGTSFIVGNRNGLFVYSDQGDYVRTLDSNGVGCRPIRWWDQATILVSCIPRRVSNAGGTYWQLWLVPSDGGVALNLTNVPANPGEADYGYTDAWWTDTQVYLQWSGGCAMARVDRLYGGGSLWVEVSGQQLVIGTDGTNLMLHMWDRCDERNGMLRLVSPYGEVVANLFPRIEGVYGVISAVMVE
jgi:hypothetical protein